MRQNPERINSRHSGPITKPTELANWIMMGNNQKGKASLIVEGTSDSNMFLFLADAERCRIFSAQGKENVLGAMEIIRKVGYPGVLAVVDADLGHIEGTALELDDVVCTDTHDMETMMLGTQAFQKVLLRNGFGEMGGVELRAETFEHNAIQLLDRLIRSALRFGYLRWASDKHDLGINFNQFDHSKVIDASTLVIREDRLEEEVLRASTIHAGDWREIRARADALCNPAHDPLQVCNGHDLTSMLSLHLSRVAGSLISRKVIERDLRLAYGWGEFQKTNLCRAITDWERRNTPKKILRIV